MAQGHSVSSATPFWNVNVPPSEQTSECPDFLQYAFENEKDREILSTPDSKYQRHTWDEVQQMIRENRLDIFQRVPSDLRTYREYCAKLVKQHGSIMAFVMQERLRWADLTPSGPPFTNPDDFKILYNDWPYGLDERIVHLVVWTKFDLPADPASDVGDLTPEGRAMIQARVDETFAKPCGTANVIWFKNWTSLKSIHAVEHFHVMLFDPDPEFVRKITDGDVPLAEKVKAEKNRVHE